MTESSPKSPPHVLLGSAPTGVVGSVLMLIDGGETVAGVIMIMAGVPGTVMHKAFSKREQLRTAGSGRMEHKRL